MIPLGKAYPHGVVVLGETCEDCRERVRYWNDASGGNAACACCVEGAESCEWITRRPEDVLAPISCDFCEAEIVTDEFDRIVAAITRECGGVVLCGDCAPRGDA